MENIATILGIILLVFGMLQIILFFKIWGMTNDVKDIKRCITPSPSAISIIKDIAKGHPDIANILFDAVFSEMSKEYTDGDGFQYTTIVEKVKPLCKKAGVKFPDTLESIKTDADWAKYLLIFNDRQSSLSGVIQLKLK